MVKPVYTSVYPWNVKAHLGAQGWPPATDRGYVFWLEKLGTTRLIRVAAVRCRLWDALGMQASELLG